MVSLQDLNAVADEEFVSLLGGIYEHSDWVPRKVLRSRPFSDFGHLRTMLKGAVDESTAEAKLALIRAHPDLAGKLARAGALTLESTREQAGLGLDRLSNAEYQEFYDQNQRYRDRFGFPFIICARLTTRQGVLDAFDLRLSNSQIEEISAALGQIHEIARLRLEDLIQP